VAAGVVGEEVEAWIGWSILVSPQRPLSPRSTLPPEASWPEYQGEIAFGILEAGVFLRQLELRG